MASHHNGNNGKQGRNKKDVLKKDMLSQRTFSSPTIIDLVIWLRRLASNPVNAEIKTESAQKLWDQMLNFRKLMVLNNPECRRSKRKLDPVRSSGNVSTTSGPSSEKYVDTNTQKKHRKVFPSVSCLSSESSSPHTANVSYPSSSDQSSSKGKFHELLFNDDENVKRPVIPIGPGFQAELYGDHDDSKTLKWLGTKIWPVRSRKTRPIKVETGKARPSSCSCVSLTSTDCIKHRMDEARQQLRSELGPAFLSWKFDEIGEDAVSGSWTAKEEGMFGSLVGKNPVASARDFWELASKCFPSRSKKKILNYYYNVFLIKRMRSLTKTSLDHYQIVSDDDQADHFWAG